MNVTCDLISQNNHLFATLLVAYVRKELAVQLYVFLLTAVPLVGTVIIHKHILKLVA